MRAVVIGCFGAVIATAVAIAVSPLFPVGLAGIAEPAPGVRLDGVALLFGAIGTVVAVVLLAALPALRVERRQDARIGDQRDIAIIVWRVLASFGAADDECGRRDNSGL